MGIEMAALHDNDTWDLVPLPSGKHNVGCRWVFTIKLHPHGTIERYKARLVAKGFTQTYIVDTIRRLSLLWERLVLFAFFFPLQPRFIDLSFNWMSRMLSYMVIFMKRSI
ncbi:hypothetical protein Dimus_037948 [Dionaea muscipula]